MWPSLKGQKCFVTSEKLCGYVFARSFPLGPAVMAQASVCKTDWLIDRLQYGQLSVAFPCGYIMFAFCFPLGSLLTERAV